MNRLHVTEKNNQDWFRGQAFSERSFDPEFERIASRFLCGDVLTHGSLSDIQRTLVMLTALTANQTLKALSKYTLAALDMGAEPEEIKETLYQCTPYIGLEKVWCALDEVNKAFQDEGIPHPLYIFSLIFAINFKSAGSHPTLSSSSLESHFAALCSFKVKSPETTSAQKHSIDR